MPLVATLNRLLSWIALIIAAISFGLVSVNLGRLAFNTNRGIDISDEGLAIASALTDDPTVAFTGLSGSYLRYLMLISGEDIGRYRLLGLLIAIFATLWLATGTLKFLPSSMNGVYRWATSLGIIAATVGGFSFLYPHYTPSYQWLVLVGLSIAGGALLRIASTNSINSAYLLAALVSLGCFLSVWGRPFSGSIFWLISQCYIFLAFKSDRRLRMRLILTGVATLVVLAFFHILFVASISESLEVYRRTSELLALSPTHGWGQLISTAIKEIAELPVQIFEMAWLWPYIPFVGVAICWASRSKGKPSAPMSRYALTVLGVVSLFMTGVLIAQNHGIGFLVSPGAYVAYLALLVPVVASAISSALLSQVRESTNGETSHQDQDFPQDQSSDSPEDVGLASPKPWWITVVAIAICPFLYGFTSDNGVTIVAGWVGGFITVATCLVAIRWIKPIALTSWLVVLVALVTSFGFSASVQGYFDKPVRQAPSSQSNTSTVVMPNGSELLVSPEMAAFFTSMRDSAKANGFKPGTPLIDLTPFSSMVGVTLDAKTPSTIYLGSPAMADLTIERESGELKGAWLLTLDQEAKFRLDAKEVTALLGKRFPEDYEKVNTASWPNCRGLPKGCSFTLWKPR